MAKVEFIKKRIAGKEAELAKLQKKLERILKAEATNWEVNPYYYSDYDKKWTLKYIDDAQKALDDYKAQLAKEEEKAASRNVPAILEFLDQWKKRVYGFYAEGLDAYFAEEAEVQKLRKADSDAENAYYEFCRGCYGYNADQVRAVYESEEHKQVVAAKEKAAEAHKQAWEVFWHKCYGYFEKQMVKDYWGKERERDVKVRAGEYEKYEPYTRYDQKEAYQRLQSDLDAEANRKYDFIIERTNAIVGTITDASGLYIGNKADLNGFIVGTNGTAKVETIGAGGYNIQCYHFRTLINRVR